MTNEMINDAIVETVEPTEEATDLATDGVNVPALIGTILLTTVAFPFTAAFMTVAGWRKGEEYYSEQNVEKRKLKKAERQKRKLERKLAKEAKKQKENHDEEVEDVTID